MNTRHFIALAALAVALISIQDGLARGDKSNVGQKLPELKLTYLDEAPSLEGKPMILEFWATWCPPCRASIPHMNEVFKKYKDKGLNIVGVSDEDESTIKAFRKDVPMNYTVAMDEGGKLGAGFGINGIPHALLVDKEGKIVWEGHPMELEDKDIRKVLR